MTRFGALIAAFVLHCGAAQAQDPGAFLDHLGRQGCIIGPATEETARAAGFDSAFVAAQVANLRDLGQPLRAGHTLVDGAVCTIALPDVPDAPSLDDPDVLRSFVPYDDGSGAYDPGCVLDRAAFEDRMPLAKGWTADETALAYMKLVAAGLVSGELRFYSPDILATPPGVERVTGRCAGVTRLSEARRTRDEIGAWFDPFVRAIGPQTPCRNGATWLDSDGFAVLAGLTNDSHQNAWLAFEMWLIALGGGWYDFAGAEDRGTPRPPACGAPG